MTDNLDPHGQITEHERRRWPCCDQLLDDRPDTCLVDDDRHPYGHEPMYAHLRHEMPTSCRDCGVASGGLHHARCCIAQCRRCGGQAVCCDGRTCQ